MRSLEEMIRPPMLARAWPRDLLWFLLLAALAASLVPLLNVTWADLFGGGTGAGPQDDYHRSRAWGNLFSKATRLMASIYLPMALGFLLCLRCGAIDVSVWVVSSLGGVLAAHGIVAHHLAPWEAMALGVLGGAVVGALNGLLTAVGRLPSLVATFLTGMAVLGVLHWTQAGREIALPERAFNHWHLPVPVQTAGGGPQTGDGASPAEGPAIEPESQPLYVTRMLLVLGAYSLTMLVLMAGDWLRPRHWGPGSRRALWVSMAASGALSAAGGVLWLVDRGVAPVATRLVDDFTVPVAALLAGGAFLAGRGRTLLAAVFLPGALLLTSLWNREVNLPHVWGYPLQGVVLAGFVILLGYLAIADLAARRIRTVTGVGAVVLILVATLIWKLGAWLSQFQGHPPQTLLLGFMILLVHVAGSDFTASRRAYRAGPLVSCLLAVCGIVLLAASAGTSLRVGRWVQLAGLLVWVLAAGILLTSRILDRREGSGSLSGGPSNLPPGPTA